MPQNHRTRFAHLPCTRREEAVRVVAQRVPRCVGMSASAPAESAPDVRLAGALTQAHSVQTD